MKVNFFPLKQGNAINRVYRNVRSAKRIDYTISAFDIGIAALNARSRDIVNTSIFGFLGCVVLKCGRDNSEIQSILKPYYQEIVQRAKQIKSAKKSKSI